MAVKTAQPMAGQSVGRWVSQSAAPLAENWATLLAELRGGKTAASTGEMRVAPWGMKMAGVWAVRRGRKMVGKMVQSLVEYSVDWSAPRRAVASADKWAGYLVLKMVDAKAVLTVKTWAGR